VHVASKKKSGASRKKVGGKATQDPKKEAAQTEATVVVDEWEFVPPHQKRLIEAKINLMERAAYALSILTALVDANNEDIGEFTELWFKKHRNDLKSKLGMQNKPPPQPGASASPATPHPHSNAKTRFGGRGTRPGTYTRPPNPEKAPLTHHTLGDKLAAKIAAESTPAPAVQEKKE
jgi:hypothetical protein